MDESVQIRRVHRWAPTLYRGMVQSSFSKGIIEATLDLCLRKIVCLLEHSRQNEQPEKQKKGECERAIMNLPKANVLKREHNKGERI